MNTRKLLNQRRKTHLKYGGGEENNTITLTRPRMQYNTNVERNQNISGKMGKLAIQRLNKLERQAPTTVRKMKEDFFQVSNNMYKLATAIKSVSNITSNSIENASAPASAKNKKSPKVDTVQQKKALNKMKGEFFEVSTRLVSLADSIKKVENTLPGIKNVNQGTNMSNYVRRQRNSNK